MKHLPPTALPGAPAFWMDPAAQRVVDQVFGVRATPMTPRPAWSAPALLNSWVNFGAPYSPVGYLLDGNGFVHLRGLVKNGATATSLIFTLPAGFRPETTEVFVVNANNAYGQLNVLANGNVVPLVGSTASFSLDGVSFRAV